MKAATFVFFWGPWAVGAFVLGVLAFAPHLESWERSYCDGSNLVIERFDADTGLRSLGIAVDGCADTEV